MPIFLFLLKYNGSIYYEEDFKLLFKTYFCKKKL